MHQVTMETPAIVPLSGRADGPGDGDDLLRRLEFLNEVGVALSGEKDLDRLLE